MRPLTTFSDAELCACVVAPSINRIDSRKTTITGTFAKAIMPVSAPRAEEVRQTLEILGMTPEDLRCAYCGDAYSEWDHFRATARDLRATGYGTSSKNLVPSCGKCNQSRGNKHWKAWITGTARLAPINRRPDGLEDRMRRLEEFEKWSEHAPLDYAESVAPELIAEYWRQCDAVVEALERAQAAADEIRAALDMGRNR